MNKETIILVIGCIICILILSRFSTYVYVMRNLPNIILTIATNMTHVKFKHDKKQIYTKQGQYTSAYNKAIQNKVNELNISCQFYSKDFYYFYRNNMPVLKCRIYKLVRNYIKEHSNISLANNFSSLTPERFFKLRKTIQGDMVGVYILYNKNRKMYYVGQATRLFFRVNQHFTGHGNGDVYGDYKRGEDKFVIKLVPLVNSGYYDLDKLEKDLITKYDSYNNGYNKTAGNG